jgi:hypothetical protein
VRGASAHRECAERVSGESERVREESLASEYRGSTRSECVERVSRASARSECAEQVRGASARSECAERVRGASARSECAERVRGLTGMAADATATITARTRTNFMVLVSKLE